MKSQYLCYLVAAAAALSAAGCSSGFGLSSPYSSGPRDMVSSRWRDYVWANRAYETRLADSSADRAFESDFRRGFVAGYQSVSQGGDGTVPAMPPRKYWGSQYLSPDGQSKARAWFEGFPAGVQAAQTDGIDAYRDIYVSQLLEDVERHAPGTKPEIGRHMKDLPVEDQLPPQQLIEGAIESAPPVPPTDVQQISYVAPETTWAHSATPHPMQEVDFASYQAAPRLVPTPKVPVVQPKVSR